MNRKFAKERLAKKKEYFDALRWRLQSFFIILHQSMNNIYLSSQFDATEKNFLNEKIIAFSKVKKKHRQERKKIINKNLFSITLIDFSWKIELRSAAFPPNFLILSTLLWWLQQQQQWKLSSILTLRSTFSLEKKREERK